MAHQIILERIVNSDFPAVIRITANKLIGKTYINLGDFLQELNQADLNDLLKMCDDIIERNDNSPKSQQSIFLVAEMLSQATGVALEAENSAEHFDTLMYLLSFESLARKGIIKFDRKLASLEDMNLEDAVEITDKFKDLEDLDGINDE
jgi:hypothetical protein